MSDLKAKDKQFQGTLDVVNLGIWLHENGYFKDRVGLFVYWLVLTILTLSTQLLLIYLIFVETDFLGYSFALLNISVPDKVYMKELVCSSDVKGNIGTCISAFLILSSIEEKLVLIIKKERQWFWKLILYVQIMIPIILFSFSEPFLK